MITRSAGPAMLATLICIFTVSCSKSGSISSNSNNPTYSSTGIIKAIDTGNAKVTIDHQDIPGFMSAMEMEFPAKDASVFSGFSAGDKVAFSIVRTGSRVPLVSMTKASDTPAIGGAEMFASSCAECHGNKGEGTKKGIPLISGHALAHSEKEFVEQVTNGKANKMPAFREKLTDEQIASVVRYVRDVIQKDLKKGADIKHKH